MSLFVTSATPHHVRRLQFTAISKVWYFTGRKIINSHYNYVCTNSWDYTATQTEVDPPSYDFDDDDARSHHTAEALTPQSTHDLGMGTPASYGYGAGEEVSQSGD